MTVASTAGLGREGGRAVADGWTLRAGDRSLAAHHEHTIIIATAGAEVVTPPAA